MMEHISTHKLLFTEGTHQAVLIVISVYETENKTFYVKFTIILSLKLKLAPVQQLAEYTKLMMEISVPNL
jgi:hypothetical protein